MLFTFYTSVSNKLTIAILYSLLIIPTSGWYLSLMPSLDLFLENVLLLLAYFGASISLLKADIFCRAVENGGKLNYFSGYPSCVVVIQCGWFIQKSGVELTLGLVLWVLSVPSQTCIPLKSPCAQNGVWFAREFLTMSTPPSTYGLPIRACSLESCFFHASGPSQKKATISCYQTPTGLIMMVVHRNRRVIVILFHHPHQVCCVPVSKKLGFLFTLFLAQKQKLYNDLGPGNFLPSPFI